MGTKTCSQQHTIVDHNSSLKAAMVCVLLLFLSVPHLGHAQLAGYSFRKKLTIDATKVSGTNDLIDFPAFITVTDTDLRTILNGGDVTSDNGYDIAFTSADGITQLDHETESFDGTTGQYLGWVRIPVLDHDDNTEIYLYYGNASVTADPSSAGTWSANYEGVWHLGEEVGGTGSTDLYQDASGNAYDGDDQVSATGTDGVIGAGQEFDGTNDYITMGNVLSYGENDPVTYSAWIRTTDTDVQIIGKSDHATDLGIWFYLEAGPGGEGNISLWICDAGGDCMYRWSDESFNDDAWHYVVATYDGSDDRSGIRLYGDGEPLTTYDSGNGTVNNATNSFPLMLGAANGLIDFFDGFMDEPRVSDVVRSEDWIRTEYTNQSDPANFLLSAGSEEPTSTPGGVSASVMIWLKADAGVISPPGLAAWADQTGLSNALAVASGDPQLVASSINFNPAIEFDASGDYLQTITTSVLGNDSDYTKFAVIISDDIGRIGQIISSDASGNHEMRHGGAGRVRASHGGTDLFAFSSILTAGQPHIAGIRYGGGIDQFASLDGTRTIDNTSLSYLDGGAIQIAGHNSGAELWDGQIAEVILCNDELSDSDIQKIASYLAVKYGITLDNAAGNYIASDGTTTIWDATANSAHHYDIAGVGRDDDSGLDQQTSISSNDDAMVLMDKGSAFSNDLDFVLWGNDNGSATFEVADKHPDYDDRIERVWKAQTTGSPGAVDVRFIVSGASSGVREYALHIDSDGVFATDATTYTSTSVSGDTITFADITFSSGEFFTLGSIVPAPGGVVSDLELWLKANAGTSGSPSITTWQDYSGNGNNATQAGTANFATLSTDVHNFNPSVYFEDGDFGYFETNMNGLDNTEYNLIGVIERDNSNDDNYFLGIDGSGTNERLHFGYFDNTTARFAHWSNDVDATVNAFDNPSPSIALLRGELDGTSGKTIYELRDGIDISNTDTNTDVLNVIGTGRIGRDHSTSRGFEGYVSEVITYSSTLTTSEVSRIYTYLAIKYGFTLDATMDYVAADATTLWNSTDNSSYHHDIAGIGLDAKSALNQVKSISGNSDAVVVIQKDGGFSSNRSFVIWGNDDGATSTTTTDTHHSYDFRLEREWKAAVSGNPGEVSVRFVRSNSGDASAYGLLVDSDGTFASGATNITATSISGDTIAFEHVTLSDGDYFTLAENLQLSAGPRGPGGVGDTDGTTNLTMWLDASTITGLTTGDDLTNWTDLSGYGNGASTASAPSYTSSWDGNGFPAVAFNDNSNEYLAVSANTDVKPTSALSVFMAGNFDSSSDTYGSLINAASSDTWGDGWGIGLESGSGLQYFTDWNDPYDDTRYRLNGSIDNQKHIYGMIHASGATTAYEDETFHTFSPNSLTYIDSGDDLLIGAGPDNSGPGYFMTGEIGEVILYNTDLSAAERIIVNNYLSAKYAIPLDANDAYRQDDNGYDYDVAGIGQASDDSQHSDSQGTGALRIFNPQGLGTDEFLFWGHNDGAFSASLTDVPINVDRRMERQWRVSELDASGTGGAEVGNVDLLVDLSGLGGINAEDLRILVDNDGDFSDATEVTGALSAGDSRYAFLDVSELNDAVYFTVATANSSRTPLISSEGPQGPGGVGDTDGTSNLTLWLDAGTISAGPVTSWSDQSGYGHDAEDGVSAPGYNATALGNSQPAVTFNGSDQNLFVPGNSLILPTDELSVFAVANYSTGGSDSWAGILAAQDDDSWNDGWAIAEQSSSGDMLFFADDYTTNFCSKVIPTTDEIWGLIFDGTTGSGYMSEDSCGYSFPNPLSYDTGRNDDLLIGAAPDNGGAAYFMSGNIGEVIEYNTAVNDAQRIIIANYLAAKYAITLSTYDVYDEDILGYYHDVAGIGQSAGGDAHTDAQGTGIVRMLNPSDLQGGDFLMWGHNNGAMTATEISDIPSTVDMRLERVWKASETADVGTVQMVWDLSDLNVTDENLVRLLVDANGNNDFTDDVAIEGATLLSGNSFIFSEVDAIEDGYRFTIGLIDPSPGNISTDLVVWLKSDEGTNGGAITSWADQSGNTNDADNLSGDPQYVQAAVNYHPAIEFDGDDYLSTTATSIIGSDGDYTKYAVIVPHDPSSTQSIIAGDNSGNHDLRQTNTGRLHPRHGSIGINNVGTFVENQAHLTGFTYDATDHITSFDGSRSTTNGALPFTDTGSIVIGARNAGAAVFDGYIAEAIVYNSKSDPSEMDRIESYLAIKYGITLDNSGGGTNGDYVASDGTTTIWDADAYSGYQNDIIALGRDDNNGIYQRQSRTQDDSLRIYISNLATDNVSNTGSISSDMSYLAVGHNNGVLQSTSAINSEAPPGIESRFEREWRITNTNFAEDYTLHFEWDEIGAFDIADIRLLVDADGDFSNADIYASPDVTISSGSIIVSGVGTDEIPMNSTMFVTLASADEGTPLPIELISFEAAIEEGSHTVQLSWSTAVEIDNDFFTIERSSDAEGWEPILMIPGAGNSNKQLDYAAYDDSPLYGSSYYRLKQTDFDGRFSHSAVRQVIVGTFDEQLTVYPNPASSELFVKGSPEDLASLRVFSLLGSEITNFGITPMSPDLLRLNIAQLEPGIYAIRLISKSIKFIKRD